MDSTPDIMEVTDEVETPIGSPPETRPTDCMTVEPSKRRKVSVVWTQFDKKPEKNDDGTDVLDEKGTVSMKVVCKICNEKLVYGGRSGTSHLKRHMLSCVKRTSVDGGQPIIGRTATGGVFCFTFSQIVARRETVRYFVREELPFNKVDKPAFHRWIKLSFGPQFTPPCRSTMKKDVMKFFHDEKTILKDILTNIPGKVCLTSDLWTSNQKLGYMCITVHYITSDWKLNKRVVSFPMLPSPHTGKTIGDAIYFNLLGWNICGKIGSITLDNASNNDSAVSKLKLSLFGNDLLSKEFFHVRCNAHVMNLLVKAGLEHAGPSIENVRHSVRHVKSSQSKLQKFHEICQSFSMEERTLPIDVQTRWDSAYIMLEAAIPYKNVFDLFFFNSDYDHIPTLEDWNNAIVIRDFFKIFYESTKLFSGSNYVTSSEFCYQLSKIALVLKKYATQPCFEYMLRDMKAVFDKYWKDVPLVLGLASCMDPRYKFTVLELCLELNCDSYPVTGPSESELKIVTYKSKLTKLFDVYQKKMRGNVEVGVEVRTSIVEEDDMVSVLLSQRREASYQTCKSDLQRYLDQPILKVNDRKFNVLGWWKDQESTYPILAAMARDLLCIPVSTVSSEAAFSASGRIVSKYRSSLLSDTIEALMCLRDWFQAQEGLQDEDLNDIEELMGNVEL